MTIFDKRVEGIILDLKKKSFALENEGGDEAKEDRETEWD